ncbi:iron export ABC transporter permease subunit FetB [bacterium]|nr:iron export ABC transporter permease subunit FetB [bacterium]
MTNTVPYELDVLRVSLAAGFVVVAGIISVLYNLGLAKRLAISTVRTALQLGLAGVALSFVFGIEHVALVLLLGLVMVLLAGREALNRQSVKLRGTAFDVFLAMTVSSFTVSLVVTGAIIGAEPIWRPPVFVPILGMILGNSLNGISLALDRFLTGCVDQRALIETRLSLGATAKEAVQPLVRDAVRTGMIPIINAMAIVGIVSLPGMMTGQLLAGADPKDAVMYQVVVMYMLAASTSFAAMISVLMVRRRVFTSSMALRQDLERS